MAETFKDERYCDAAKFFFAGESAYPSPDVREDRRGRSLQQQKYNSGVKRC